VATFTAMIPFQAAFMCCTRLRPKPVKSEKLLCPLFLYFGYSTLCIGRCDFQEPYLGRRHPGFFPQEAKGLGSRVIALKGWGADFAPSCTSSHWQDLCVTNGA